MVFLIIELLRDETVCTRFRVSGRRIVFDGYDRATGGDEAERETFLAGIAASRRDDDMVILAVDPALLSCREVALPITDRRKLREILPLELKGETLCDTDELVFDSIVRSDGTQFAIWGRKKELSARIKLLAAAGLDPQVVTAALFHWKQILPPEGSAATVLLADRSAAALFRNGEPTLFRTFRDEEPDVEIGRTIAALEIVEGVVVDHAWHFGGLTGVETTAASLLPLPPDLAEAFGGDEQAAASQAGAYALAVASRNKEIINFRHGELGFTSGSGTLRKKFLLPAILTGLLLLIIFSDLGLRYYYVKQDITSLNTSISGIYREIFPNRKKAVDEVGEVKSEIRRLSGAGAGIGALAVLKKLAEIKGDDIFGFFDTEIDGGQIRLRGDAKSIQAVTALKIRAEAVLKNVEVGEISSKPDGTVTFSLRGVLKEETK